VAETSGVDLSIGVGSIINYSFTPRSKYYNSMLTPILIIIVVDIDRITCWKLPVIDDRKYFGLVNIPFVEVRWTRVSSVVLLEVI